MSDVEGLLRRALAPVEPSEDLADRLRATLQNISDAAAEELEGWELAAMRDPRNWVRPAAAVVGGALAGVGLLLLGRQQRHRSRALLARLRRSFPSR
jgi:type VI protein secretion system component VasF